MLQNLLCVHYNRATSLASASAGGCGVAVVAGVDFDTNFGRDNGSVDVVCEGAENDDVGSVVRKSKSLDGISYIQAYQQQTVHLSWVVLTLSSASRDWVKVDDGASF